MLHVNVGPPEFVQLLSMSSICPTYVQASALSSTDLEICSISAFLRDGQNVVSSVHLFLETSSLCQQELWEMQHRYSNYK